MQLLPMLLRRFQKEKGKLKAWHFVTIASQTVRITAIKTMTINSVTVAVWLAIIAAPTKLRSRLLPVSTLYPQTKL